MDQALFGKFKRLASVLGARMFCETGEEFLGRLSRLLLRFGRVLSGGRVGSDVLL